MNNSTKLTMFLLLVTAVGCSTQTNYPKDGRTRDFNFGWKFAICEGSALLETPVSIFEEADSMDVPYGSGMPSASDGTSVLAKGFRVQDSPELASPKTDDSRWRMINLPHDWAVEGDFNRNNPSGTGGGALPGGIGWYRKTFRTHAEDEGKCIFIDFDGVYMNSTVWINGIELGTRPYGYISFSYDLTPYLKWGKENVIAVRVDNSDQPNSRWYSGCGIYRNVWLRVLEPVHVAKDGIFARTETTNEVLVTTTIENSSDKEVEIEVLSELIDRNGKIVASSKNTVQGLVCDQILNVMEPRLWSCKDPYLYELRTIVLTDGIKSDEHHTNVGIRTFSFDAEKGFYLNGKAMKINGVCQHHDLGCLGAALNVTALRRQLSILKEMGVNGVRCSHNPPAPELLDLCDEMGFLVMDEPFDMWRQRKTERDYARFFDQWHERDLTDHIVRDRSHPSIVMWSIGNEVLEQWSNASADTLSIEQANFILNFGHGAEQLAKEGEMSINSLLAKKLADMVRELDPTRPVTSGCNEPDPGNHVFRSNALDVIGFNYHDAWFAGVPKNFQGKPFIVSESVSSLMTRGWYRMPSDSVKICPPLWDDPKKEPSFACSSYDNYHVPWGSTHEKTLSLVKNTGFISGQFVWTGFDYIGEPIPYGWPARSSFFGLVDLAGFPKDIYYLYQSEWRHDLNVLHIFPHWNWAEGDTVDVWAYYNNADEVELFVNGISQGVRRKLAYNESSDGQTTDMSTEFHTCWRVKYTSGEVRAVSRKDGVVIAEKNIRTAGKPAQLRLTPYSDTIKADGYDLAFVTVEIMDADGNLCPFADNDIQFTVNGAGFIAGVDNGSPITLERFKADHRKAMFGKCLLVVQNNGKKGKIEITAKTMINGKKVEKTIRLNCISK